MNTLAIFFIIWLIVNVIIYIWFGNKYQTLIRDVHSQIGNSADSLIKYNNYFSKVGDYGSLFSYFAIKGNLKNIINNSQISEETRKKARNLYYFNLLRSPWWIIFWLVTVVIGFLTFL